MIDSFDIIFLCGGFHTFAVYFDFTFKITNFPFVILEFLVTVFSFLPRDIHLAFIVKLDWWC